MTDFEESDYEAAAAACRSYGRISPSAIQRALCLGYIRASKLADELRKREKAQRAAQADAVKARAET